MTQSLQAAGAAFAAFAVFVALDGLWLGLIMRRFYRTQLSPIARMAGGSMAPIWPAAALVYVLLSVGVVTFVVPPAEAVLWSAAACGAIFGLVIYGFYNLTNYATLARWPSAITVVDMAWGVVVCAVASAVATCTSRWLA
jgi:uncharacterized membrane protein